jgi:hypothetical protein
MQISQHYFQIPRSLVAAWCVSCDACQAKKRKEFRAPLKPLQAKGPMQWVQVGLRNALLVALIICCASLT